jgi:hypothetical protein
VWLPFDGGRRSESQVNPVSTLCYEDLSIKDIINQDRKPLLTLYVPRAPSNIIIFRTFLHTQDGQRRHPAGVDCRCALFLYLFCLTLSIWLSR